MHHEISKARLLANATAAIAIIGLALLGITRIASRHWQVQPTFVAKAEFANIAGIAVGDPVHVQGIDAGIVASIDPPSKPGSRVVLTVRIDSRLQTLVRQDAVARISTQGVVGAKVVEIEPGLPDAALLATGGTIQSESPIELSTLLRDASLTLKHVDDVAVAARVGLVEVNSIATSIRKGEGSLGKFVHDDNAYQRLIDLTQHGEKTLIDLEENLSALKRTWPISRYFNDRAFFDRDRVLFQPGAERDQQIVREGELFEPDRSVLTEQGRRKLDSVAAWFKQKARPTSEVVIAAFTNKHADENLAEVLTQEQADSVRRYLINRHEIDSLGWFSSRKVAAVGFGSRAPTTTDNQVRRVPPPERRVEIIVFTPQG